jgi:hypothetical protein
MRLRLLAVTTGVTLVTLLPACASLAPAPTEPVATAAAGPTGALPAEPLSRGTVITAFHVIGDVSCSGAQASVPMSWSTRDAQTVEFQVDGQPVGAGAGYPVSGTGNVAVPCDGREHEILLVASGPRGGASLSRHVNTSNTPPPSGSPSISRFDVLGDVTCTGTTVEVAASWATQNAQAVNFSVDGQPLPLAAGFPVTGSGNIPVPCDGAAHKVTATATGTGTSASASRSVNTSTSSGGTTTTATPTRTTAQTIVPTAPPTTGG